MSVERIPAAAEGLQSQWNIDHAGKIDKRPFQITLGLFFGLAAVSSLVRFTLRLRLRHKLFLDDALVLFALLALAAATGVLFSFVDSLYKVEVLTMDRTVTFTLEEAKSLLPVHKWLFIFLSLNWTAIFAIKFSFLVFSHLLIRDISRKLNIYYWASLIFTGISWAFIMAEPWILCPYLGIGQINCSNPSSPVNLGLMSIVNVLDLTTDAMVVSIPIIVLRNSGLRKAQKLGIAVFLCLSVAMILITIIRLFGAIKPMYRPSHAFDMVWHVYWQHIESNIALFMGSVTAFRGIFAGHVSRPSSASTSIFRRLVHKLGISNPPPDQLNAVELGHQVPVLPEDSISRATLEELQTFFRRHRREPGNTTVDSTVSAFDVHQDYHKFQRSHGIQLDPTQGRTTQHHHGPTLQDEQPELP